MFFPVRTDRRLKTTPWVNYVLIGMNIGVFLLTWDHAGDRPTPGSAQFWLFPNNPNLLQYFTYQFFHLGWAHLIGNMLFLFVFGNSVEDRLGHVGYLLFYLAGGVIAGVGHGLMSSNPVLGASGSIAAVTGAYLALFPLSNVTIVYWIIVFGAFEVSSMVLILFRIAQDFIFEIADIGNTAYSAHLAGYLVGFLVGMGLLLGRMLPREPYDMLALIEQKRRRSRFKSMTRGGYRPWESGKAGAPAAASAEAETTEEQRRLMERRAEIAQALRDHRVADAARLYSDLVRDHPDQVMSQQQQLDLANQLMSDGRHDLAATAYERLLTAYPHYPQRHHVKLVLGLIYARYLGQQQRARELLEQAEPSLHGDDQTLAKQVLSELPASA